jgi:hypothetical protein
VVRARKVVLRNEAHQGRSAEYSGRRGQLFGPSCSLTNTQSHTCAAAVLVDEFDAGGFQATPNRQVVSSRHRRLAVGQLGAADSCHANGRFLSEFFVFSVGREELARR